MAKHKPQDCPEGLDQHCPSCDLSGTIFDEAVAQVDKVMMKHDRHACPIYRKTLAACKDCLPGFADNSPVPMCKTEGGGNVAPKDAQGHPVYASCGGEKCGICYRAGDKDVPARHKVGEEILDDDPVPVRHNLTQYVCCRHYVMIVGPWATSCAKPDAHVAWGDDVIRAKTLEAISGERSRHRTLGFSIEHTYDEFVTILTEELGEVARAVHQSEGSKRITEEAVQLAAAAVAFCEKVGLDWRKA